MAEIYGLYSGRDGRVRYVGQTLGLCTDRFKQHPSSRRMCSWFHNEWRDGYPIGCVLLESCDDAVRSVVERRWIRRFPAGDLLNERDRPWFAAQCGTPPKIPEIRAYMRRYLFNVGGFRGVHYDRQADYYFVRMYTGSNFEWLLGNEMPDWSGNIFFPARTAALIARDKDRRWRQHV